MSDSRPLEETQLAEEAVPAEAGASGALPGGGRVPPGVRVGAIDAERLRSAVASRLFGVDAEPVKIGRYTVLKRLGAGGMGVVYSAYDDRLDRKVAIKLLRGEASEQRRSRLLREAQALARVAHPNVIGVFEAGTFRQQVYVAMEFVRGPTLAEVEVPERGAVAAVLDWFRQAGQGLAAAHEAGLVHRDFKPENCIVGDDGRVRVLDFGLARAAGEESIPRDDFDEEERAQVKSSSDSFEAPLTRTGAIMGTPAYMAPEQHLGGEVDARTDQFAFCISLWEKLYGERPFAGETLAQLSLNVTGGKLREAPSGRRVPTWVHRALVRGLGVHPEDRWPDMDALLEALSPERRRRVVTAVGLAGALVIGVSAFGWLAARGEADPCAEVASEIQAAWDGATRTKIEAAFAGTQAAFAADAFKTTASALDDYTARWVDARRRTCEASQLAEDDPELFGRKMICLGRRLAEVEALTRELGEADEDAVKQAVQAVSSLGPIEACEDETRLAALEVDVDEATRAQMDALERLLARGQTKVQLGRYADALEIADDAVTRARELGRPRLEARALLLLGRVQGNLRQLEDAEQSLREALRRADVARDDGTRVEALSWLLHWVGYKQRDFAQAEEIAADARAALERMGEVPLLEADLYDRLGSVAVERGDLEAAIADHQRALDIRVRELGERSVDVAKSRNNLGNALLRKRDYEGAERELRAARSAFEELQGPKHPYVAITSSNIGASVSEQGRASGDPEIAREHYVEAEQLYRRAIEINAAAYGPNHRSVAVSVHNLGEALRRQGRFAEALEQFDRALRLKLEVLGDDHVSVAVTRNGRGAALWALGSKEEGRAELERAWASFEAAGDGVAPEVRAECAFDLAETLEGARRRELGQMALDNYTRAGAPYAGESAQVRTWLEAQSP